MTSDLSPAERLTVAADLLEQRAGEATEGPWNLDGPWWWNDDTCSSMLTSGVGREAVVIAPNGSADANLRYIAIMDPEKGEFLAKWLREEAAEARIYKGLNPEHLFRHALGFADRVLAGEPRP